jgi:hypothetical protein
VVAPLVQTLNTVPAAAFRMATVVPGALASAALAWVPVAQDTLAWADQARIGLILITLIP